VKAPPSRPGTYLSRLSSSLYLPGRSLFPVPARPLTVNATFYQPFCSKPLQHLDWCIHCSFDNLSEFSDLRPSLNSPSGHSL